MNMMACSVFDLKVNAYMPPFYVRSKLEAVRSFSDAVGDATSQFCKHPEDYTLFQLGWFNDATGELSPDKSVIITALECRANQ